MSLISGRIKLLTYELFALVWRKFQTFKFEYLCIYLKPTGQSCLNSTCGIIAVGKGCIRVCGRLAQNARFHDNRKSQLTYNGENDVQLFSIAFDPILYILTGNEAMHKISDEF